MYAKEGKRPESMVKTDNCQQTLIRKAQEINDESLLHLIQGYGNDSIDMIAYGICYHKPCMNRYTAKRSSTPDLKESRVTVTTDGEVNLAPSSQESAACSSGMFEQYDGSIKMLIKRIHDILCVQRIFRFPFHNITGYAS